MVKIAYAVAMVAMVMMSMPAYADTGKPSVTVSGVTMSPAVFMPGDTGTITVTITNPSRSLAGDSTSDSNTYNYGTGSSGGTSITHSETTTTTNSNTPDGAVILKEVTLLADSPVHVTSNYQYLDVGRLGMGDKATLTFTIKVDDNAANALYPMTLKVRTDDDAVYLNYPLTAQVDNSRLNVILNDAPQAFSTSKQSVVIDIMNPRPNQVDGVSVIPSGDDFVFKPIQEYAVGSIGAGELYTVQFDVTAKNASYSGNPSFKVVYMNGDNQHQTDPITVYTDHNAAAKAPSSTGNGSMLLVIGGLVVVVVLLACVFLYMRGKNNKR